MSWEGWMGATSDGWAACQPPDPDTAQSAIFLKVPLSQTGVYAVMLRWSRLRPLWALIHRGLLALVELNAGAKHPTAHFFKFRFDPHPLRFRDRTMSDKTEGVKLSLDNHFYSIYSENFDLFSGFRDITVHFFLSLILFWHVHYTHIKEEHSINVTVRWTSDCFNPLFK